MQTRTVWYAPHLVACSLKLRGEELEELEELEEHA